MGLWVMVLRGVQRTYWPWLRRFPHCLRHDALGNSLVVLLIALLTTGVTIVLLWSPAEGPFLLPLFYVRDVGRHLLFKTCDLRSRIQYKVSVLDVAAMVANMSVDFSHHMTVAVLSSNSRLLQPVEEKAFILASVAFRFVSRVRMYMAAR